MIASEVLSYVNSLKNDERIKKEIDAWVLLGLCTLCTCIRRGNIQLTDEEKEGLKELDEMLAKYEMPKIFLSKYGQF